jgi:DnaK suppressor protein
MNEEEIREKILTEIAKTESLFGQLREATKPVAPDVAIGRVSLMDAINNKSVAEASLRQAELKLNNLQMVLSRVGTNEFGLCARCSRPIPLGRILIRPESLHCVNCAR